MTASHFQLYIIRHAQSGNNALPEDQRVEDPAITELGQQQVASLADRFRGVTITHALTSAFRRAIQTMQPLAKSVGIRPLIWTDLHEVGGCYAGHLPGQLQGRPGMNRQTLNERFPEFAVPEDIDEHGWWKSDKYEDIQDARDRAESQAARLLSEFSGSDAKVACVIHADFKDLLLRALLKNEFEPYANADLRNTGVTELKCFPNGIEVVQFNDISHLSDDLTAS